MWCDENGPRGRDRTNNQADFETGSGAGGEQTSASLVGHSDATLQENRGQANGQVTKPSDVTCVTQRLPLLEEALWGNFASRSNYSKRPVAHLVWVEIIDL